MYACVCVCIYILCRGNVSDAVVILRSAILGRFCVLSMILSVLLMVMYCTSRLLDMPFKLQLLFEQ